MKFFDELYGEETKRTNGPFVHEFKTDAEWPEGSRLHIDTDGEDITTTLVIPAEGDE